MENQTIDPTVDTAAATHAGNLVAAVAAISAEDHAAAPAISAEDLALLEMIKGLKGEKMAAYKEQLQAALAAQQAAEDRVAAQDVFEDQMAEVLGTLTQDDLKMLLLGGPNVRLEVKVVENEDKTLALEFEVEWDEDLGEQVQRVTGGNGTPWTTERCEVAFKAGSSGKAAKALGIRASTVAAGVKNFCGLPYAQARAKYLKDRKVPTAAK